LIYGRIILKWILKGSGWECVKQIHFAVNVYLSRNFMKLLTMIQCSTQSNEFVDCVSEASCRFVQRWSGVWNYSIPVYSIPFHCHVRNATIPCRSQELRPFLPFMVYGIGLLVEVTCINVRRNTTVFSNCWRNQLHVSAFFWVGHRRFHIAYI
jgi:hypothetical protein